MLEVSCLYMVFVSCNTDSFSSFTATTYTLVKLPDDEAVTTTFTCTLKFIVKDCDPNTGEADEEGYEDEYIVSRR